VFLVPGFFGFTSVGAVSLFRTRRAGARSRTASGGVEARIIRCKTSPRLDPASPPMRCAVR